MTQTILDDWLAQLYLADSHGRFPEKMHEFKTALAGDSHLKTQATIKMAELDGLIAARGRNACAYSTKYNDYLHGALGV